MRKTWGRPPKGLASIITALACLLLVGCSDPRPTTDEIYASEMAESLAAAEVVYMEFDAAELKLTRSGGAETLPDEFHQWLTDNNFAAEEQYIRHLWDQGIRISGDPHDEITDFIFADDVELRPNTYLVAYACGRSWGGISTDKDGNVLYDGSLGTYRRTLWFTKVGPTLQIKIEWLKDELDVTCD
jgi:hypothetical protein